MNMMYLIYCTNIREMIKSKILEHPTMLLSWLETQLMLGFGFIKGSLIIVNASYTPDFLHQTSFHWSIILSVTGRWPEPIPVDTVQGVGLGT